MTPPKHRRRGGVPLVVRARRLSATQGRIGIGHLTWRCALGRGGRIALKREGDGGTPIGRLRLLEVLYRADRGPRPRTMLPMRPIRRGDGWCDAVGNRNYNRPVRHPYPASAEHLWRTDQLYDLVVVLDHNVRHRARGRGSAIFMHVARPGYTPTEGCIALSERDLRHMLTLLRQPAIVIVAG